MRNTRATQLPAINIVIILIALGKYLMTTRQNPIEFFIARKAIFETLPSALVVLFATFL